MPYLLVLSTLSSKKQARKLADLVLSKRLAACVSVSAPMESVYWWKGKKETSKEIQLCFKTKKSAYKKLELFLKQNHPYKTPEIIAVPILKGSPAYLRWLDREVR